MLLGLIVIFLLTARWCFSMYRSAKDGRLERNYQVGIKTRWTIASDETWEYVHRKYAFVFLGCGVLIVLMTVGVAVGIIVTHDINNLDMLWWWVLLALAVILVMWLVICGVIANLDAKNHYLDGVSASGNDHER
ncbi:SdpI family protein [Bifidobacterium stellenboschense]|uniref:Putative membrane spanning protein n=1 Tax=Bifidobacterium stellenboschense TaxID=762211 RepID=A0A087DPJ0_9BIFI|nr:SdpI family protein [Bifidobacterium stellenboschense]KFI97440.1 putative membrane spanning protein [Bifidobacterium stellenboschense]